MRSVGKRVVCLIGISEAPGNDIPGGTACPKI